MFSDQITYTAEQRELCGEDEECLYDFAQTGDANIAMNTKTTAETTAMNVKLLSEEYFRYFIIFLKNIHL